MSKPPLRSLQQLESGGATTVTRRSYRLKERRIVRIIDSGDYALMSTSIVFLSGWILCNIVLLRLNKFVFGYYCTVTIILILCKQVDEMGVDKMEQK